MGFQPGLCGSDDGLGDNACTTSAGGHGDAAKSAIDRPTHRVEAPQGTDGVSLDEGAAGAVTKTACESLRGAARARPRRLAI